MLKYVYKLIVEEVIFMVKENLSKEIERLKIELDLAYKQIKRLQKENEDIKNKTHNERGAGRKSRFTEQQVGEITMYRLQGKTIREIAEMYKCSSGLIHSIVKDLNK